MNPPSIHPHANLETLLDGLLESLRSAHELESAATALRPVPVIVPSIQFTDWLQVSIAKRRGLCMGLEFLMPQEFIDRALALADSKEVSRENPWSKRDLTWRLLPHIKDYVDDLGVSDSSPRDRFVLAVLLADQFDQYGHFRPEIITNWAQGKSTSKRNWNKTDRQNEAWQRKLWRSVQTEIDSSGMPASHPALLLDAIAGRDDFLTTLKRNFPRLFVAGTGALDPLLVRVLQLLGKADCEVHGHLVLPSLGYLGEMRKASRIIEQDPEDIEMRDGHPLLVSMGRNAVGSFLLLGELDENYTHWPDGAASANEASSSSLLGSLQADIRQLRKPSGNCNPPDNDLSLRVHSCYGPRREMEVLRDELLRAFRDIEDLKPEEVIVVTPSLEVYAPLVGAVLEQIPALPVRLTELPPSGQEPMIEGLLALLEMAWGSCEASRLLELLHLRAVRACLGILDDSAGLERLHDWIRQSGLTRGLDAKDDHCAAPAGSWRFARDRMIAGKWFGVEAAAQYPGGNHVLPVAEDLGGDAVLRQSFLEWHWRLSQTLSEWRNEATPGVWSERLEKACDQLLSSEGDEDSRLEIQYALNFLARVDCAETVDSSAIFDWLQSESAESGRRTPVSGRITFGRLKQLQNIPCRVLAMVGMQDGAFPRQNRIPAWDLLHLDPRAWDRNARTDDRQLFLDAVLNPTDRLIITGSTRNVRSGKLEPFSSCVDELLRVAQATLRSEAKLLIEHRLQPFAAAYFMSDAVKESLPLSFDSNSAKVADSFRKSRTQTRKGIPFWNPVAACNEKPAETLEVSLDQLVNFWKDPSKAFLKAQGIALAFDEGSDEALDRTPLGLDGLGKWAVKTAIVRNIMEGGSSLDYTEALLFADRGLPPLELGRLEWDSLRSTAEPLGKKVSEIQTAPLLVDFRLPGNMPPVRITGKLLRGLTEAGEVLLACRVGKFKSARDYLQAWILAVASACAGHPLSSCILDEENLESPILLKEFDQEQALGLLGHLIDGFMLGQSLPLGYAPETSDAYARSCQEWEAAPDENALRSASDEWNKEPFNQGPSGEGSSPASRLAWRDQDPFTNKEAWHRWAHDIARPLRAWFNAA